MNYGAMALVGGILLAIGLFEEIPAMWISGAVLGFIGILGDD